METRQHRDAASFDVAGPEGDIRHELVDRMGQRFHLAGFTADRQRVGLIKDGDVDGFALGSGIHMGILRPSQHVHLPEKFLDADARLFALAAQVV